MAEIIKTYKETLPALRLIGKRYGTSDFVNGSFGAKWGEFFEKGWFDELEKLGMAKDIENGYLGFMRCNNNQEEFEYWIGMFFAPGMEAPAGYEYLDLEGGDVGVCWIKGSQDDGSIYGMHDKCEEALKNNGMGNFMYDEKKYLYHFERYNCPRFTEKDSDGNVILDYGIYLKG
jgi:predicted transcriptional regulator YdeE